MSFSAISVVLFVILTKIFEIEVIMSLGIVPNSMLFSFL